jgi:hypothetical protein
MVFIVLAGEQANAAAVAETPLGVDPVAAAGFPATALTDGKVSSWFNGNSAGPDGYMRSDLNRVKNGGLEGAYAAGVFESWTNEGVTLGGAIVEETVAPKTGTRSAKLTCGAGPAIAMRQEITVRSGSRRRGVVSLYSVAGASVYFQVFNVTTGRYLDPTGAWVKNGTHHKVQTAAALTVFKFSFRVQSRRDCCANLATLRYRVYVDVPAGVGYFDEMREWPETNCAILASHNLTPATAVEFRSSTDNFIANDVLAKLVAPRERIMYAYLDQPITSRYVGLKFPGTPATAIRATECIFGYADAPKDSPMWPIRFGQQLRQMRDSRQSLLLGATPDESLVLSFETHLSEMEDMQDFVLRGLDGSLAFVVPTTDRDELVLGRLPIGWNYAGTFTINRTEIPIESLPFPLWTP